MAPGCRRGAIALAIAPQAPTGVHRMTRSAPRTASAARRIDGARPGPSRSAVSRVFSRLRVADDGARQPAPAHGVAERRADQADADQRHPLEHGRRHDRPMKLGKAATTARLSSSVPMVMRRQSGRP